MARVLSISYDEALLRTREMMLIEAGHRVTSALGYQEAVEHCTPDAFDVLILGHSIPQKDKKSLIQSFRTANRTAVVIALTRMGEARLEEVDHYLDPSDPAELLRAIAWILDPAQQNRRRSPRSA